jgi:hypothetical protein
VRRLLLRLPYGDLPRAAGLAATVTVLVLCAGNAVARAFPFGPRSRSVNDLGNQYVPYHAHLWDLLHGRAQGDLFLNWRSGFGASFLPDLGTYLTSPFAPLVALFPRDGIDLAVFVITVLKMATAAALMAVFLLVLRDGPWWGAGLLGASYGLCGWALADAVYNTMWLDGLIALPLLFLVGEWTLTGRRPVLGALVVGLCWIANFYTAYMATLGAGLLLVTRLLMTSLPVRRRLGVLLRAAGTSALGIGLSAPVVSTVYFGTLHAYPGRTSVFSPVPAEDVAARLLPATYGFGSPALYVDAVALLLALSLPFNRAVPGRVRLALSGAVLVTVLSLQWAPGNLVWNAFTTPNGSPYRAAFVVCGLLVVGGWVSFAYGLARGTALRAAVGLLALIVVGAGTSDLVNVWTLPVTVVGALVAVVALRGITRAGPTSRSALWCVALLAAAQAGQSVATTAFTEASRVAQKDDYAPWGDRHSSQRAAIADVDAWPRHRTEPGREQTVGNDPLLVGGQGAQYYSSHTSDVLARTLIALGDGYTSRGRAPQSLDNPVVDAVFSVGARLHSPPDPYQDWYPDTGDSVRVTRQAVQPLVTVRPPGPVPAFGASAFRNQELLLGARVYTLPRLTVARGEGPAEPARRSYEIPARDRPWRITGACPSGSTLHMWAPQYSGTARQSSGTAPVGRFLADRKPVTKIAGMQPLGPVPASGRFTVVLRPDKRGGTLPDRAIGCLDPGRLRAATDRLTATGAREVSVGGHGFSATLPRGTGGVAVFAAPRIAGWRCAAGDAELRPSDDYLGLVAIRLDGTADSVRCTFRPPGLRLGASVGAGSFLVLVLLGGGLALRARRTTTSGEPC